MADEQHPSSSHRILVLLSGIASAAVVLSLYHCLTVNCYWRRTTPQEEEQIEIDDHITFSNAEQGNKIFHMIPSYKYDKEDGLIGDDGMCAVCLSEFEEGEEVRTLPECVHSFHVPCIDLWLYSHTSCPLCRTDTTPPHPQSLQTTSNSAGMTSLQNVASNFSAL